MRAPCASLAKIRLHCRLPTTLNLELATRWFFLCFLFCIFALEWKHFQSILIHSSQLIWLNPQFFLKYIYIYTPLFFGKSFSSCVYCAGILIINAAIFPFLECSRRWKCILHVENRKNRRKKKKVEIRGVEPRASRKSNTGVRSERSTTELHPQRQVNDGKFNYLNNNLPNASIVGY